MDVRHTAPGAYDHDRRFALPPKGCNPWVSARSRQCYQRVNSTTAPVRGLPGWVFASLCRREAGYPFPMFGGRDDDEGGTAPPRLSLRHRLLLSLPRVRHDTDKEPLGQRLRSAMLKPVEPDAAARAKAADKPPSVAELEDAVRYADDKERLMGLLLAPVAGAIGLIVIAYLTNHDPPALLHGKVNPKHVNISLYHDLTFVLLG